MDTCYSAAYMSQTQEQQHPTISEVTADWHELMIPQRIMRPTITRTNGQLNPRCSQHTYHRPNQPHQTFTPQATPDKLLLISHIAEGKRLSGPEHTVGQQLLAVDQVRVEPAPCRLRVQYSAARPLHPLIKHSNKAKSKALLDVGILSDYPTDKDTIAQSIVQ